MARLYALLPLAIGLLLAAAARADGPDELDWTAWQHMPVFHRGRMMPVNTFARISVEEICGRVNPRLGPADEALDPATAAGLRKLFPEGKPRRFTASELLFAWLVEPQLWEDVPFLFAGYEPLRKDLLGQPVRDEDGKRLRYVSPRQVAEAGTFRMHLEQLYGRREEARDRGKKPELTELDKKAQDLYESYMLYRFLTFNPASPAIPRSRFWDRLQEAARAWAAAVGTWRRVQPELKQLPQFEADSGPGTALEALEVPIEKLLRAASQAEEIELEDADPLLAEVCRSAVRIARQLADDKDRLFDLGIPQGWPEPQFKRVRTGVRALASFADDLARQSREAHLALYDNGHSLRLVPALNPGALETNRKPEDDAQPWLNLQTVILGSGAVLEGFPKTNVEKVRESFREAADVYAARGAHGRPERFAAAMDDLAAAVRALGEAIEPARKKLPIKRKDEELIAATAYPPPGATRAEVHYYELDPFLWSWMLTSGAMACFGLSFGLLRKPMFWLGILVLVAGQGFAIYALGLRVYITGWAPVTNMYETIVFVAVAGALLGVWFALYPMFGPGLKSAWRMTAAAGTFEATELSEEQTAWKPPGWWNTAGWVLLVPRLALAALIFALLTLVSYGSGEGYTAISLVPRADVGKSVPTANDLTVWMVGWCVLLLTVEYVPRAVLAVLLCLYTVPKTLARQGLVRPLERALDRKPFAFAGALLGFVFALLAYFAPISGKNISLLMPVLRDNFWLTIHVLSITASYAAGLLAWLLGLVALGWYLIGSYRDPADPSPEAVAKGHRPAGDYHAPASALTRRPPAACNALGKFIYKATQVACLLLAAGTITGALWADVSWGRFWGWDAKEVWALIALLLYLGVLHGRYAGLFGNFGLAVGSVLGATSIVMAWYGVNYWLRSGLHTYGEGTGGLLYVLVVVAANWVFVALASFRYLLETWTPAPPAGTPRPDSPPGAAAEKIAEASAGRGGAA